MTMSCAFLLYIILCKTQFGYSCSCTITTIIKTILSRRIIDNVMSVCLHDSALDHERVARGVALVGVHTRAVAHRETHGVHGGLKARTQVSRGCMRYT